MHRRAFISSLLAAGLAGCSAKDKQSEQQSNSSPTEARESAPADKGGSESDTATSAATGCFSPEYLDVGTWYESREFAFSVRDFTAQSSITMAASSEESDDKITFDDFQMLFIKLGIRNPDNEVKSFCSACQYFAIIKQDRFVNWVRTRFSSDTQDFSLNDLEGRIRHSTVSTK